MKQHKAIIESLCTTWNLFMELNQENLHPDTQRDFCNGIHNLQRIIATEAAFIALPGLFNNENPLPEAKPMSEVPQAPELEPVPETTELQRRVEALLGHHLNYRFEFPDTDITMYADRQDLIQFAKTGECKFKLWAIKEICDYWEGKKPEGIRAKPTIDPVPPQRTKRILSWLRPF